MKTIIFSIAILITITQTYGQNISLSGKVIDYITNENLSYANIRVDGSSSGTAANAEGIFELKLKHGNYKIITSFIGYKSDTLQIRLNKDIEITIALNPIPVKIQEVTVLPAVNPAITIIDKAIKAKQEREEKIKSYIFKAYTKGLVKTTQDISASNRSVGISLGVRDTGELKIAGIIENESIGYYKKPDKYKDEILARKQTANTPSAINVLTGGRLLQNFYTNNIQFFNRPIPGPISDDALKYYYFIVEDTLMMDNHNVFKINFEPIDNSDPGFFGNVYIIDSLFALAKVDVNLNDAANPGGLFNKVNIFQQFIPFGNNIYMPIDYRIFVEGNFIGMAKFGFELNSIFYDYEINKPIDDSYFGMAVIKVLPGADDKDSLYWSSIQSIPNTFAEIKAYARIDSLESIPRNFWDNFSLLSSRLSITDNSAIAGPISLYSFNKIAGHSLSFGVYLNNILYKRFSSSMDFGFGFSDKKFKTDISMNYRFGEYKTGALSFSVFNKLATLFEESIEYSKLTSTLTSLLGKYDFRDYYYTKGFEIKMAEDVLPFLRLGIGFKNVTDNNAFNNSEFSLLNRSKTYNENSFIYETKINSITTSLLLIFENILKIHSKGDELRKAIHICY